MKTCWQCHKKMEYQLIIESIDRFYRCKCISGFCFESTYYKRLPDYIPREQGVWFVQKLNEKNV